ncbi:MAG: helix-turn-helix transcriptional regulator, partial [Clostridia bacterium]|nr:helix-turn-helix transcriptional regulator [Clostridia bacterium]
MEQSLEQIVAANLAELRKARGWTQAELAERINYSDKSVSKWERGDGLPDLKVLTQLASLYGVSLDTFVTENAAHEIEQIQKPRGRLSLRILTELLAVSIVFLAVTVIYVLLSFYAKLNLWTLFTWAVPLSFGILTVLNIRWNYRVCAIVFGSLLSWSFLTALYLQLLQHNVWMLYIVGIPAQAAIILFSQY